MRKSFLELFIWGLLFGASTAWANSDEADDTWNLVVGAGVKQDDNLFRAPAGREVSDEIRSTTLGLKIDKQYSLQRFTVDASMTDYRYRNNSDLNYTGSNSKAAWAWSLTPKLYGNLSTSKVESLVNFVDYVALSPQRRRNIRTTTRSRFDVEWEAFGPVHLISAVSHYDLKNSQTFIQEDNYSARDGELGVKYVTSARNFIALVEKKSQGDYARGLQPAALLDSGFNQTEHEVRFFWMPTVKSSVYGRVAYLDREYDNYASRNYSGYVGSVDANWGITSKLSLLATVRRDLNAFQESSNPVSSYSSFYSSNNYTLAPAWEITSKTRLQLRLGREVRSYQGTIINGVPLREDHFTYRGLALDWEPRRNLDVNFSYTRQTRNSSEDLRDFNDNIYMLTGMFKF